MQPQKGFQPLLLQTHAAETQAEHALISSYSNNLNPAPEVFVRMTARVTPKSAYFVEQ